MSECNHSDVASGVCLGCGHGVLRFSIVTNDTPDGWVLVPAEVVEEIKRLVVANGERPCDCTDCYCGNVGDARKVAWWDERDQTLRQVLALLGVKEQA